MNDPFEPHTYTDTVYWINGGSAEFEARHNALWREAYRLQQQSELWLRADKPRPDPLP
jgi:hypothetical protein